MSWAFLAGFSFYVSIAFAAHGHWTDHYTNAFGMPCCGVRDCVKIPMRVIAITDETFTIDVPSRHVTFTIPRQSYHLSEDEHDYWCAVSLHDPPTPENTRCVFIAIGS